MQSPFIFTLLYSLGLNMGFSDWSMFAALFFLLYLGKLINIRY